MDAELKKFEEDLERLCPVAMPDGMIARMEAAMDGWQDQTEEKVVPFPVHEEGSHGASRSGFWAAAAAVAVLGALVALFVPSGGQDRLADNRGFNPSYSPASFSPVGASSNIVAASDEGFVVTRDAVPHRAVRVEYMDRIELKGNQGQILQVESPRVRIVLIPVRVD